MTKRIWAGTPLVGFGRRELLHSVDLSVTCLGTRTCRSSEDRVASEEFTNPRGRPFVRAVWEHEYKRVRLPITDNLGTYPVPL
jgi:hypothetical protein